MDGEGVVKFAAEHTWAPLAPGRYGALACKLAAWRRMFYGVGLVGQDPERYGGAGYGNLSARVGTPGAPRGARAMLITGTQIGGLERVGLHHFSVVECYDFDRNWVRSTGSVKPSSEAMTHGAIYDLSAEICFVFHVHSPAIWRRAGELGLATTPPEIGYGTPEMARAVAAVHATAWHDRAGILAMSGHEDGVIGYGCTADAAAQVVLSCLSRAYEMEGRDHPPGR